MKCRYSPQQKKVRRGGHITVSFCIQASQREISLLHVSYLKTRSRCSWFDGGFLIHMSWIGTLLDPHAALMQWHRSSPLYSEEDEKDDIT